MKSTKSRRLLRKVVALTATVLGLSAGVFLPAPASAQGLGSLQIRRAVQVDVPTEDGRRYQVESSSDLTKWTPSGDPVVGTGTNHTHVSLSENSRPVFFKVRELPGVVTNRLAGLVEFGTDAATVRASGGFLTLSNLRVRSSAHNPDDHVEATFVFDTVKQVFRLDQYQVAPAVGVYNEPYFARDTTNTIQATGTNGVVFRQGVGSTVTFRGEEYVMNLEVGNVVSFELGSATADFSFVVTGPDGRQLSNESLRAGNTAITGAMTALTAGTYRWRITPLGTASTRSTVIIHNCNSRNLTTLTTGSFVSISLTNNSRDTRKYKVTLTRGQILSLPDPANNNHRFTVLDRRSKKAAQVTGLPLLFVAPADGDYYLFIDNVLGWGGSYSGTVSITGP